MTFGENLVNLRKRKGVSQEQLAEVLGLTRQTISKWELNQSTPDLQYILQMGEFFNVSLDYIFGRTDNPQGMQKYPAIKSALEKDGGLEALMTMCFTPGTVFNEKLKEVISQMLREVKEE